MPSALPWCVAFAFLTPWAFAVSSLGFTAPFNALTEEGDRVIAEWQPSGDARILKHFVRLTRARASQQGALWSARTIGVDEFSALFKFRISGPETADFGEGLALWFAQGTPAQGPYHGHPEQFTGFGVVFDNYRGAGRPSGHLDVLLVINDGSRTAPQMEAEQLGCTANLRYHEERADFTAFNATRVSLAYKNGVLTVGLDARNTNDWVECVTVRMQLAPGWLRTAHLGVTATTSASRFDNHDVLSLKLFAAAEDIQTAGIEDVRAPDRETLEHLMQHLEHQLAAVQSTLESNLQALRTQETHSQDRIQRLEDQLSVKLLGTLEQRLQALEALNFDRLREQEAEAERRIQKLEESLDSQVHSTMEGRITSLETQLGAKISQQLEKRITSLEADVDQTVEHRLQKLEDLLNAQIGESVNHMVATSRTWLGPFVLFGFGMALCLWMAYRKFYAIQKMHQQ